MTPSHYRDIRISHKEEMPHPLVMSQLFERLHREIANSPGSIAVSFPEFDVTLGSLLRLHGSASDLQSLGLDWLGAPLSRLVRCGGVFSAPSEAPLQVFRRVQPRAGGERWLRRWMQRHPGESPPRPPEPVQLRDPFVQIRSKSTGQPMVLFIVRDDPSKSMDKPNSYGLGSQVPVF